MEEDKEVTLEELAEMINAADGDFIIHVEPAKEAENNARKE